MYATRSRSAMAQQHPPPGRHCPRTSMLLLSPQSSAGQLSSAVSPLGPQHWNSADASLAHTITTPFHCVACTSPAASSIDLLCIAFASACPPVSPLCRPSALYARCTRSAPAPARATCSPRRACGRTFSQQHSLPPRNNQPPRNAHPADLIPDARLIATAHSRSCSETMQ